jgi:hypothetical protein
LLALDKHNLESKLELVLIKFEKKVAERTICDYLKRWNFTPQKPAKRAYQRDPEKVDAWLNVEFPKIAEEAEEVGADIFFCDESGVKTEGFILTAEMIWGKFVMNSRSLASSSEFNNLPKPTFRPRLLGS